MENVMWFQNVKTNKLFIYKNYRSLDTLQTFHCFLASERTAQFICKTSTMVVSSAQETLEEIFWILRCSDADMIAVACHLEMNVDVVVRLVMFYGTLNIILPWLGDTLWLSKVLISLGDGHIGYEFSALEVLFFQWECFVNIVIYTLQLWKAIIKQLWPSSEIEIQICQPSKKQSLTSLNVYLKWGLLLYICIKKVQKQFNVTKNALSMNKKWHKN